MLRTAEASYSTVDIVDTIIGSPGELFGRMLGVGGLPEHYLGDVWHDAIQLQELWRMAEQRYREDSPICLQFYWGVRDCGTQMAERFNDAIAYPMGAGMRFFGAYRITLYKRREVASQSFRMVIESIAIPCIEREGVRNEN